jgi:hypothetical protein
MSQRIHEARFTTISRKMFRNGRQRSGKDIHVRGMSELLPCLNSACPNTNKFSMQGSQPFFAKGAGVTGFPFTCDDFRKARKAVQREALVLRPVYKISYTGGVFLNWGRIGGNDDLNAIFHAFSKRDSNGLTPKTNTLMRGVGIKQLTLS